MSFSAGVQSGLQLGGTLRQGMVQNDLAEEAKKYRVTEGAYGSELQQNIDQVRALQAQNPEQAAQYEPAIAELTRRQGLTAPDYSVSSGGYDGGQNYATMKEAQAAASPLRTQGLANVYRESGYAEKADELEGRALQNRAAALQVKGLERTDKEATAMQAFESDFNQLEDKTNMDAVKQLASKHNLNRSQQFTVASQMSGIEKAELEMMDNYIKKATKGKDLDGLLDLHKNDKKFADGTHFVKAVGKDGQVILNLVSDADPTKVLRTEAFKSPDMATAYLRKQAEDPGNVAEWTLGVRKLESQIKASEASTRASDAYATNAIRTANKPDWMSAVDSKGTLQLVDRNKLPVVDGVAQLPTGLKPVTARAEYTAADVLKMSDQLSGQTNPTTNKPYTPEEAVAESKRILSGAQDPFMAKLDAALGGAKDPFAKDEPKAKAKAKEGLSSESSTAKAPTEERFARQKTNRGAYTYTPSNRGLTRAQYEEIDRKKQIR